MAVGRFLANCFDRLFLAWKWLMPEAVRIIFPVLVILNLLLIDFLIRCMVYALYHFFGPIVKLKPLGPFLISSLSKSRGIKLRNLTILSSKNFLSKYFSLPLKNKSILILSPSFKKSSACVALISRSCFEVPMPMRILLISTSLCFLAACFLFFSSSFFYKRKSNIGFNNFTRRIYF